MGEYLSMPDPCPHVSRMDVIRARLARYEEDDNGQALFDIIQHFLDCPDKRDK